MARDRQEKRDGATRWKTAGGEEQQLEARAEESQKRLQELMDIMSYLKSIEQLRERKLQEYKDAAMHEEQKVLDELGQQLVMRRKGAAV